MKKTAAINKTATIISLAAVLLLSNCSSVKENGEPEVKNPAVITNDEQRKAIYEGNNNTSPQNANPIPSSGQLGLDEKSSEINRKKNIEDGSNPNMPANIPTEERPRQLRNVGNDTIVR